MVSSRSRTGQFLKPCFIPLLGSIRVVLFLPHKLLRNIVRLYIHELWRVLFFCRILGKCGLCLALNQRTTLVCRSLLWVLRVCWCYVWLVFCRPLFVSCPHVVYKIWITPSCLNGTSFSCRPLCWRKFCRFAQRLWSFLFPYWF